MEGTEIIDPNEEGIAIPEDLLEEVNGNTEEETTEEETVVEENTNEEDNEETEEKPQKENEEDFKDKESLLKALNNERKQRKELQKQLKSTVIKEEPKKSTYDSLVESGIDSEIAKTIAKAIEEPKQEVAELRYEKDIVKMSKRAGFEDVEEYAEDMKPLIDKGLTYEQAYYAVSGSQKSVNTKREIEREIEAKMQNQKVKQKITEVDSQATSPETKEKKVKYTNEQVAVARAAGMSVEEYLAFSNMTTTKDYEKYKNK